MYKYLVNSSTGDVLITASFEDICWQVFRKQKPDFDAFYDHPDKEYVDSALKKLLSYPNFIVCYSSSEPYTSHKCTLKNNYIAFHDMAQYQNDQNEKLVIITRITCEPKDFSLDIQHRTLLKSSTIAKEIFHKIAVAERLFIIDEFLAQ